MDGILLTMFALTCICGGFVIGYLTCREIEVNVKVKADRRRH